MKKSVDRELENALFELFSVLDLSTVLVKDNLEIDISNFVRDIKRVIDEIKQAKDLARMWHISEDLASKIFNVIHEVLFGLDDEISDDDEESEDTEETDDTEDSSDLDADLSPP